MKIQTCAALLIAMLTISILSGCSVNTTEEKLERVEDSVEKTLIQVNLPESTTPTPQSSAKTTTSEQTQAPEADTAGRLTTEEVQTIALEHAGFTADQVQFLHAEFEIDDQIPQYEVQFHQGPWEYEYEIHAETGAILSFEKDD